MNWMPNWMIWAWLALAVIAVGGGAHAGGRYWALVAALWMGQHLANRRPSEALR